MQGFSAFESPPPRAVGSLGDSTLFGADSEAAAAAAAASAAAAAAAGAAAAAAAAATPGAGCSGEGSSDNTVPMSEKYRQQFEEVRHLLKSRCLFTEKTVDKHLLEYYNHLGLNEFYFRTAKPSSIADNLQAVIAARALHAVSGTEYFPEIQQIDERTGEVFALSKASLTAKRAAQNYKTERKLEQLFLNMGREENKQQMRMQCYRSTQSVFGIDANFERLRTYFFQKPDFPYREEEVRSIIPFFLSFFLSSLYLFVSFVCLFGLFGCCGLFCLVCSDSFACFPSFSILIYNPFTIYIYMYICIHTDISVYICIFVN